MKVNQTDLLKAGFRCIGEGMWALDDKPPHNQALALFDLNSNLFILKDGSRIQCNSRKKFSELFTTINTVNKTA